MTSQARAALMRLRDRLRAEGMREIGVEDHWNTGYRAACQQWCDWIDRELAALPADEAASIPCPQCAGGLGVVRYGHCRLCGGTMRVPVDDGGGRANVTPIHHSAPAQGDAESKISDGSLVQQEELPSERSPATGHKMRDPGSSPGGTDHSDEAAVCEFCDGPLGDKSDHGLGECCPICPTCDGTGSADEAAGASAGLVEAVERLLLSVPPSTGMAATHGSRLMRRARQPQPDRAVERERDELRYRLDVVHGVIAPTLAELETAKAERDRAVEALRGLVEAVDKLRASENTERRKDYARAFADDDLLGDLFDAASAAKEVLRG